MKGKERKKEGRKGGREEIEREGGNREGGRKKEKHANTLNRKNCLAPASPALLGRQHATGARA